MEGLHICQVETGEADARDAYVEVANGSPEQVTGMELANYTSARQHVTVYVFPKLTEGRALALDPGQSAYVFSTEGFSEPSDAGWLLFAGWTAPIWNGHGDVAYLRDTAGRILDSMIVGQATRHRNGHQTGDTRAAATRVHH